MSQDQDARYDASWSRWKQLEDSGKLEEATRYLASLSPEEALALHELDAKFAEFERVVNDEQRLVPGTEHFGYRLEACIGGGSSVIVWSAAPVEGGASVALKFLRRRHTITPREVARFQRSVETQAGLDHPAIERIEGLFSDGLDYAAACERVDPALTLDKWIRARRPRLGNDADWDSYQQIAVELFLELADALETAHGMDVVHRDVKPSNILVRTDERPVLVDFGAALRRHAPRMTLEGRLLGTLEYMSPESLSGGAPAMHGRADVFSLGLCMYEALVGRPASRAGSEGEVLRFHQQQAPVDPTQGEARVDPRLARIVIQATRPNPRRRYRSAAALRADLQAWLDGKPIAARGSQAPERAGRLARRYKRPLVAVSLVFGALGTGFGVHSISSRVQAANGAGIQPESLATVSLQEASAHYRRGDLRTAHSTLAPLLDDQDPGWLAGNLRLRLGNSVFRGAAVGESIASIGLHPELPVACVLDDLGREYLWDSGALKQVAQDPWDEGAGLSVRFNPGLDEWVLVDHLGIELGPAHGAQPARSPQSQELAQPGQARLTAGVLSKLDELDKLRDLLGLVDPVQLSWDGSRLAGFTPNRRLTVTRVETGEVELEFDTPLEFLTDLRWSADGTVLLAVGPAASAGYPLLLYSAINGELLDEYRSQRGVAAWSANGQRLVVVGDDDLPSVLDLSAQSSPVPLFGLRPPITALDCSADGTLVLAGNVEGELEAWMLPAPQPIHQLAPTGRRSFAIELSDTAEQPLVAVGSIYGTVRLWNPITGAPIASLRGHDGWASVLAFAASGKLLFCGSPEKRLFIWDTAQRQRIAALELEGGVPVQLLGHPSRELALVVDRREQVLIARPTDEEGAWEAFHTGLNAERATLSAEGRELFLSNGGEIEVHELDRVLSEFAPLPSRRLDSDSAGTTSPATAILHHPTEDLLITSHRDGTVQLRTVRTKSASVRLEVSHRALTQMRLIDDGSLLACLDESGDLHLHDLESGIALDRLVLGGSARDFVFDSARQRLLVLETSGRLTSREADPNEARRLGQFVEARGRCIRWLEQAFVTHHTLDAVLSQVDQDPEGPLSFGEHERARRLALAFGDPSPIEIRASVERVVLEPGASTVELRAARDAVLYAVQNFPEDRYLNLVEALTYLRLGQPHEALAAAHRSDDLGRAGELERSHAEAWAVIAMAHDQLGERRSSIEALERAAELLRAFRPTDSELLLCGEAERRLLGEFQD